MNKKKGFWLSAGLASSLGLGGWVGTEQLDARYQRREEAKLELTILSGAVASLTASVNKTSKDLEIEKTQRLWQTALRKCNFFTEAIKRDPNNTAMNQQKAEFCAQEKRLRDKLTKLETQS